VAELSNALGFSPKAPQEAIVVGEGTMQDLDGDLAAKGDVVGEVDVSRRATSDGRQDSVSATEHPPDVVCNARNRHNDDARGTRCAKRAPLAIMNVDFR
jgi:hypothetical protein